MKHLCSCLGAGQSLRGAVPLRKLALQHGLAQPAFPREEPMLRIDWMNAKPFFESLLINTMRQIFCEDFASSYYLRFNTPIEGPKIGQWLHKSWRSKPMKQSRYNPVSSKTCCGKKAGEATTQTGWRLNEIDQKRKRKPGLDNYISQERKNRKSAANEKKLSWQPGSKSRVFVNQSTVDGRWKKKTQ